MKPTHNNARRQPSETAGSKAGHLLGEACALVDQIGSAQILAPLDEVISSLRLDGFDDLQGLQTFLEAYSQHILQALEFPAIALAYGHASRGEASELIALDQQLKKAPILTIFADASQRIGRRQLLRLRPLRDQRVVQRYLAAMESGHAHGWHPLVYGVTLAVYSLPLRQALLHYAEETLAGLALAAAQSRHFPEGACRKILEPLFAQLPAAIEKQAACQPMSWQIPSP